MRLTSRINQTKEEIKVMSMVYIWEENKVLIGMRKRKQNDEDLCTYLETGKSYRTQDWYHCHTCGFDRNEGVCTTCVKTWHSGHDVRFHSRSRFFCDWGAKGQKYCKALVSIRTDKEEKKNSESILQEVKEDWKLDFKYNQVSIIDFEFKKKKQNNLEENIIARKWQLAELD